MADRSSATHPPFKITVRERFLLIVVAHILAERWVDPSLELYLRNEEDVQKAKSDRLEKSLRELETKIDEITVVTTDM